MSLRTHGMHGQGSYHRTSVRGSGIHGHTIGLPSRAVFPRVAVSRRTLRVYVEVRVDVFVDDEGMDRARC